MYFLKNHKTSLEAEEMQLIRPTSEFKVGHLPFQGKVKGILPRWGRSKPSGSTRITFINCNVLSPDFQGRRPVLTLPRRGRWRRSRRKHHFPACKAAVWFLISPLCRPFLSLSYFAISSTHHHKISYFLKSLPRLAVKKSHFVQHAWYMHGIY